MQFPHLLRKLEISQSEFSFQFQSHPDHPSALAFSETLNFMGIRNSAYELEKEFWGELPVEFITIYNNNFAVVEKENNTFKTFSDNINTISKEELYEKSSNFVLLYENKVKPGVEEKINYQYLIFAFLGISLIYSFLQINLYGVIFNALSILGIYLSLELFSEKFGQQSVVLNNICRGGTASKAQSSCSKIIDSDGINIMGLKLVDLSLIYFIGILVIGIFLPFTEMVLKITSGLSLFVIIYSLYIQIFVEKSLCRICLVIITVLIFQIGISNLYFMSWSSLSSIALSIIALGISFSTLSFINNILKEKDEFHKTSLKHLRFKRNYEIFLRELLDKEKVNFENVGMFFLGSRDAKIHISLVSNPYCGFCKEAHKILGKLLRKYSGNISAQIRFNYSVSVNDVNFSNLINDFVHVYNNDTEKFIEAVDDWFDYESEKKIHETYNRNDQQASLEEIEDISLENQTKGFNFTPIFFINGHQFPDKYDREDIFYFIDELLEEDDFIIVH